MANTTTSKNGVNYVERVEDDQENVTGHGDDFLDGLGDERVVLTDEDVRMNVIPQERN